MNNRKQKRRERYALLRSFGFTPKEATQYKVYSDKKIQELIKIQSMIQHETTEINLKKKKQIDEVLK